MANHITGYTGLSRDTTLYQVRMGEEIERLRLRNNIQVRFEQSTSNMQLFAHIRIGNEWITFPMLGRDGDVSYFIFHIFDTVKGKYGGQIGGIVANLLHDAWFKPGKWCSSGENEEMKEAKASLIEKEKGKYMLSCIYLLWMLLNIPSIPEELVSALELAEEAMKIQKDAILFTEAHMEKVRSHYQKYGTLWEKLYYYLK